ncbi:MAG: hypothetical protein EOO43_00980 [Flavobacterium sp.]|nr:MAG: hypothetical protein EOO43_00980 [Flavobacterium sp.]
MGSSDKRKTKDQIIIKRPKSLVNTTSDISGSSSSDLPEEISNTCPPSLQITVTKNNLVAKGIKVDLVLIDRIYKVQLGGAIIGQFTERQSNTIAKCSELGVKYKGLIVEDKGIFYARFIRVA